MKRIKLLSLLPLTALTLLLGLTSSPTKAQLKVAGIPVDLGQTGYINGKGISPENSVHYNQSSKTLTLRDATIEGGTDHPAIESTVSDLRILLENSNYARSKSLTGPGVKLSGNTTILGLGSLEVNAFSGIQVGETATLTIDAIDQLSISYKEFGLYTLNSTGSSSLVIKNSKVWINPKNKEKSEGSLRGFDNCSLIGSKVSYPVNAEYKNTASPKGLYDNESNLVKGLVEISITEYQLRVGSVTVTPQHTEEITGEGIEGTVRYNNNTRTLTLENAKITHASTAIESLIIGLTVILHGENVATSLSREWETRGYGMESARGGTIKGGGTLTAKGLTGGLSLGDV